MIDLGPRPGTDKSTVAQNRDPIRQLQHFVQMMTDQNDGKPSIGEGA